jgi:hypothetical protein
MQPRLTTATLATLLLGTACQDPADDQEYCQWTEGVVPLDYSLGPRDGDLNYDLTPRKVLDQITIPQRGELTWNGGGDWVDITPNSGTTEFVAIASYNGTTVFRRILEADGSLAKGGITLPCPPTLDFDMTIRFETDDGVLDETWETTLSFDIWGHSPSAELDAEALGLPQKLQISNKPNPPASFYDERYSMSLGYRIDLLSPDAYPPRFGGELDYGGTISEEMIGEIINVTGFRRTLFEWTGFAEGTEPTRRPPG